MTRRPRFLARRNYRRRRLIDAARMVPVLAIFLFLLPVLWRPAAPAAGPHEAQAAAGSIYLFTTWAILIAVAYVLALFLRLGGLSAGEAGAPEADDPAEPD